MEQEPLLIFRENHGKFFAATVRKPKNTLRYMHIAWLGAYILIAEHWLEKEEIKFREAVAEKDNHYCMIIQ